MGQLSAAALAEFRSPKRRTYYVVEADFPDGTKLYSKTGVCSRSLGYYRPRVKQLGSLDRSQGDREFKLIGFEPRVTFFDPDYEFANLVGSRAKIRNSAIRIRVMSPNYGRADDPLRFVGRLYDWVQTGPLEWQWLLRPQDAQLYSIFPWLTVQKYDFINAPVESISQIVPLIYGLHDSAGSSEKGDRGAVPLIYVGERGTPTKFCYLLCRGRASLVLRVYDDAVLVPNTQYTVTYPSINGRVYTLVEFNSDRGDGAAITADVKGYGYLGDGSPTDVMIADPADQLAHAWSNWLYGEFTSQSTWLPTHATIDTASFTLLTNYFFRRAYGATYKGSMWIGERISGKRLVDDWCATHKVHAFWKNNGTFAVAADDLTEYPAPGEPRIVYPKHELGRSFRLLGSSSESVLRRVVTDYSHQAGTNQYLSQLEIVDKSVNIEATEDATQSYGPHFL